MESLIKLVTIGSEPLEKSEDDFEFSKFLKNKSLIEELEKLYSLKNGFYAFEAALHIFPISDRSDVTTFQRWNSNDEWRYEFPTIGKDVYFFAEDAFGIQFCLKEDGVFTFDGETCKFDLFATSLEDWAKKILGQYNLYTGYSLVHEWQQKNGPLKLNKRLGPKIPFVLGGKFELENLGEIDSTELMRFRGSLYKQVANLPDGTKVKLVIKKSTDK